ncbi:MAG: hypothetical protein KDE28_14780 [Anaerolineales bacterium]|nr:hypothetical protein [Anaerolineales bacterium]
MTLPPSLLQQPQPRILKPASRIPRFVQRDEGVEPFDEAGDGVDLADQGAEGLGALRPALALRLRQDKWVTPLFS